MNCFVILMKVLFKFIGSTLFRMCHFISIELFSLLISKDLLWVKNFLLSDTNYSILSKFQNTWEPTIMFIKKSRV